MPYQHTPVMLNEVIAYLNCEPGKIYVDGTLGGSGHARAILDKIVPDGMLIGIDQDLTAIRNAKTVLNPYKDNIRLFHGNYVNLADFLKELNTASVDGILLDLGLSFHQIDASGRGFSFNRDEPLDMRMNVQTEKTADQIVNSETEETLAGIFREYGEERYAKQIARRIVKSRAVRPIQSSRQLGKIVSSEIYKKRNHKKRKKNPKIHPATRVFMALRIAVNDELKRLDTFMKDVVEYLNPGGRLCVLSFHSLEDRIVKQRIRSFEKNCTCPPEFPICVCGWKRSARSLTKKVLRPTREEVLSNPMARSTRMRVMEKL